MSEHRIRSTFHKVDDWYHADSATIVGDVTFGARTNVWFGTVVRGDEAPITIGQRVNLQDLTLVHADPGEPQTIGDDVTVGHRAILHGGIIGDDCLIGMGAILLQRVVVGAGTLVGAGAVVAPGTVIPPNSLVRGVPGRVVRETTEEERASFRKSAEKYAVNAERYHAQYPPTAQPPPNAEQPPSVGRVT